jgi:general secretion pathway protein E
MEAAKPQAPANPDPKDHKLTLAFVTQGLVKTGILDAKSAESILKQGDGSKEYPLQTIVKFGVKDRRPPHLPLTLESLVEWLASFSGKPYFEIDPLKIDIKAVTAILPTAYVRRLHVIPVKIENDRVWVATAEPYDLGWVGEVQTVTGKKVSIVVSNPAAIRHFLEEFLTVRTATQDFRKETAGKSGDFGQVVELDRMLGRAKANDLGKNASAVIRIVDWLFQFAQDERATDIHLEPKQGRGQVRFRIDGSMRVVYTFDPELMIPVMTRVKILAEMQVDERRKPQDGRIRYKLADGREMEMRLSTIPVQHGEKLVVRVFDPNMTSRTFEDLGFAPEDIKTWESLINLPHGLVLVTGPTGSGKSTTLHTSLRLIAHDDVNVCTVEDPIEIVNDELNQMQVNTKLEITFGSAIRSFLRQDPDIIMVGEIRDQDAGRMAIQAALTGHLVLSTLHTNDAISSITRLIDLEIPAHLITASVRGMMAQRLVRKLCIHCKKQIHVNKDTWHELCGHHRLAQPAHVYEPVGCRECKHTGYMGRLCVYEVVVMDRELKECIRRNVTLEELMEAVKGKYVPLRLNGARKVAEGVTSVEEVLRVVF